MNLLIFFFLLFLSKILAEDLFINGSEIALNSDYMKNEFFKSVSKIPDLPNLSLCDYQLLYISKNWKKRKIFPLIDSWGKLPSGLLKGNFYAVGNYDECVELNTKLPTPFGTLEGQYCRGMIDVLSLAHTKQTLTLIRQMNVNNQGKDNELRKFYLKSGVCIPKSCSAEELEKKLPFLLRYCSVKEAPSWEPIDYVMISIISIIGFIVAIATAYDYLHKGSNKNPYLMAFSLPTNAEKLFNVSSNKQKNNIDCLNGIRVLSMVWVIYGHTMNMNLGPPLINLFDMAKWSRTFFSLLTHNAFISVDSFFFMSGLLLSWIGMKEIVRANGKLNFLMMYLHRYLRLTPMVGFVMLFVVSLFKFLGSGPLWNQIVGDVAYGCSDNWWMNLLYIQNYATRDICLGQTWYLGIDFQLFLLSPIFLYGFWKWGKKFIAVIAILIALSVGCIYGTFYSKGFTGVLVINDKEGQERMTTYYHYTHTRYSIWLIGFTFGYLLYQTKDKEIKLPWYYQVTGWLIAAGILGGVIVAPYSTVPSSFIQSNGTSFSGASYESFSKIGWGLMLSWIVFACYHGYGGVVNSFLANPLWQPFAKLSFAMYMSHIAVMQVYMGNTRVARYFSNFEMILQFWSHFGITFLVSTALVLFIESPTIGLEKCLLSYKKNQVE